MVVEKSLSAASSFTKDKVNMFFKECVNGNYSNARFNLFSGELISHGYSCLSDVVPQLCEGLSNPHFETTLIQSGNMLAICWDCNGLHDSDLFGVKARKINVQTWGISLFRFSNGLVLEEWGFFDEVKLALDLQLISYINDPDCCVDLARRAAQKVSLHKENSEHSLDAFEPNISRFYESEAINPYSTLEEKRNIKAWKYHVDQTFNVGNYDLDFSRTSKCFKWHGPAGSTIFLDKSGLTAAVDSIAAMRSSFMDIHVTARMFGEGDLVLSQFHWSGKHVGDFHGLRATGNRLSYTGLTIGRFDEHGIFCEQWELWDDIQQLKQLGVLSESVSCRVIDLAKSV